MTAEQALEALLSGSSLEVKVEGLGQYFFDRCLEAYHEESEQPALRSLATLVIQTCSDPYLAIRGLAVLELAAGNWLSAAHAFQRASKQAPRELRASLLAPAIDCLGRAGKHKEADALFQRCRKLAPPKSHALARILINYANVLEQQDSLRRAERYYREALKHVEPNATSERSIAFAGLAACLAYTGRPGDAQQAIAEAIGGFTATGQTTATAVVSLTMAATLLEQGAPDEALMVLQRVRSDLPGAYVGQGHQLAGDCYTGINLWQEARQEFNASLVIASSTPATRLNSHLGLAWLAAQEGDYDACLVHAKATLKVARRLKNLAMEGWLVLLLSKCYRAKSNFRLSREFAAEAMGKLSRAGWTGLALEAELLTLDPNVDRLRIRKLATSKRLAVRWNALYVLSNESSGAERLKWQKQFIKTLLLARLGLKSAIARTAFFADKSKYLASILSEWLASDKPQLWRLSLESIAATRSATLIDELSQTLNNEQRIVIESLRNQSEGESSSLPQGLRRSGHEPSHSNLVSRWFSPELAIPRATRSRDITFQVDSGPDLWTLKEEQQPHRVSKQTVEQALARFRYELMAPTVGFVDKDLCNSELSRLASSLNYSHHNVLSPEGIGWQIPWSALAGNKETALCLAPTNIRPAELCRPERQPLVWMASNRYLPEIEEEGKQLQKRFPDARVCRTRQEAIESMAAGHYGLLHLAAHGRHESENPMFSYIEFPDGELTAAEVAYSTFKVDYAVLLSCESGCLSGQPRQEPDGFVRAALARGALGAIACTWAISDEMAVEFQKELYDSWRELPLAEALRIAREKVRDRYPHPFFWGSPALFLGYRSNDEKPSKLRQHKEIKN